MTKLREEDIALELSGRIKQDMYKLKVNLEILKALKEANPNERMSTKDEWIDYLIKDLDNQRDKPSEAKSQDETIRKLQKELASTIKLFEQMQTFFGIGQDIYYRDLDGNLYKLDRTELDAILKKEVNKSN